MRSRAFQGMIAAMAIVGLALVPTSSFAQRQDQHQQGGGGHPSDMRSRPVQQQRPAVSPGRGYTPPARDNRQPANHDYHPTGNNGFHPSGNQGGMAYSAERAWHGQRFTPRQWRQDHPGWDGHLYYNNGLYFYDPGFTVCATINNEWFAIAALAGGVGLLSTLDTDPYLCFDGDSGELYSVTMFDADLASGDPELRLRADYFKRPYFWRDGVRYDRHEVVRDGVTYYQFMRH